MKLHEYQAKALFAEAGIPTPRNQSAKTPEEAAHAFKMLSGEDTENFACALKAQIHAGSRGKAGGVVTVKSADEAASEAKRLLGKALITHQTTASGLPVSAVLLETQLAVKREFYMAITLDRYQATPIVLASRAGGMDIEEVAQKDPGAIVSVPIDLERGISDANLEQITKTLQLEGGLAEACHSLVNALWGVFKNNDASLVEINPLIVSNDDHLIALDAKITIDDNALFRHDDMVSLRDKSQEDAMEYEASQIGISYVGLNGTIGCLVNGAGLAMATNDIIKYSGGEPANFLDVGGGANVEQITNAFSIILADTKVKAILVNIFGGIMRCDWIAEGLLTATEKLQVKVPIVVRLQGTNVEEGRSMLANAQKLNLISVDELGEAARKVVELAK